jgi:hypothetical protein
LLHGIFSATHGARVENSIDYYTFKMYYVVTINFPPNSMMEDIGKKIRVRYAEEATRMYLDTMVGMGCTSCIQSGAIQGDDDTEYLFSIVFTKKQ